MLYTTISLYSCRRRWQAYILFLEIISSKASSMWNKYGRLNIQVVSAKNFKRSAMYFDQVECAINFVLWSLNVRESSNDIYKGRRDNFLDQIDVSRFFTIHTKRIAHRFWLAHPLLVLSKIIVHGPEVGDKSDLIWKSVFSLSFRHATYLMYLKNNVLAFFSAKNPVDLITLWSGENDWSYHGNVEL